MAEGKSKKKSPNVLLAPSYSLLRMEEHPPVGGTLPGYISNSATRLPLNKKVVLTSKYRSRNMASMMS